MPSTWLHPVNEKTWLIAELAESLTTIGGSTIPVPAPCPAHPIVCTAAVVPSGLVTWTAYRSPHPSPTKILPDLTSTIRAVNTLLVWVETVTGQSALVTSTAAPRLNTGVILYTKPWSAPT